MAASGSLGFALWTLLSLFSIDFASGGGIEHIFKIGIRHSEPSRFEDLADDAVFFDKLRFDKSWERSASGSLCVLPDSTLTVCFLLVLSYMFYIIIALLVKPSLKPSELESNPGLKSLIGDHHFKDNIIPGAIRSYYQDTGVGVHYTPLTKTSLTTPQVQQGEKAPIPEEDCVSADPTEFPMREESGTIHL